MTPRDGDDGRERRSWKEIDKMRDGSGSGGRRQERDEREDRRTNSSGYQRYKSELDRLFNTGMAGDNVAHVMRKAKDDAPGEPGEESGRAALVRACRLAESNDELVSAIDLLLEDGELPNDIDLLLRVVEHPAEAVVADALERIERLTQRQPLKRKAAFVQRLYTLEQTADDATLRGIVDRLIESLA